MGKGEVVSVDGRILYAEGPKESIKKTRVNKFSEVAGYKINLQKSVVFLSINNKPSEKETRKTIQFTAAPKRVKYLGIH